MDLFVGLLSSQLVSNLALTLIHFVWQGALIATSLWLALLCTPRNKFNLRYRFAVLALVLSVAAPIITFSLINQSSSIPQFDLLLPDNARTELSERLDTQHIVQAKVNVNQEVESNYSKASFDNQDFLGYILVVWLLGCVVMTIKFVLDLNRTFKLTREGVAKVNNRVELIVSNLSTKYKLRRRITILKSRRVNVPVVIGWLKPVILLPIAITIGLETKHLELIIAHELAHIKRMDFAVNLVQSFVQICLFYHPVIYWINKVIRDEREYICDQLALEVLGNDESAKINLAKALLGTEELREGNLSLVAVAASGGMLKHRISHILDSQYKPATSIKSLFVGSLVFLFSFAALSTTFDFSDSSVATSQQTDLTSSFKEARLVKSELRDPLVNIEKTQAPNLLAKKILSVDSMSNAEDIRRFESVSASDLGFENTNEAEVLANTSTKDSAQKRVTTEISGVDINQSLLKEKHRTNQLGNEGLINKQIINKTNQPNIAQLLPNDAPKMALPEIVNQSKVNDKLYRELSSKALSEQYLLPEEAVSKESRFLRTAALDLQSVSNFKEPKAIFTPYPKYPRRAWDKMINQTVRVNFSITADGQVNNIDIMEDADEAFSDEIFRRLKNWKYQPAEKDGTKVAHLTSLEFVFKAPQKKPIPTITTGSRIRRR